MSKDHPKRAHSDSEIEESAAKRSRTVHKSASGSYQPEIGDHAVRAKESLKRDAAKMGGSQESKKSLKRALLVALGLAVCLVAGTCIAVASYVNSISSAIKMDDESLAALEDTLVTPVTEEEPYYILLLGSDAREGDIASRSDTIVLVRIDPTEKKITMVSIPRDTRVKIAGYGYCKINAAFAYGGEAGAVEAVSEFAGVPITHCIEVYFDDFQTIVDSLDGVEVDVPYYTEKDGVVIKAGLQTLDGEEALAFCRCRNYPTGDFQRTANQRILIKAMLEEILASSPTAIPGLLKDLSGCITTDMSLSEIVDLATTFQGIDFTSDNFYTGMAPSTTKTIDGVSYVLTKDDAWAAMMKRVDAGESPTADDSESDESLTANDSESDSG